MDYQLTAPTSIQCSVELPASKSIAARALIINALRGEQPYSPSKIEGAGGSMNANYHTPQSHSLSSALTGTSSQAEEEQGNYQQRTYNRPQQGGYQQRNYGNRECGENRHSDKLH